MASGLHLNPEQRKAVEHRDGPLLVIAGPGSGKTRVITERVVYLLENVPGLQPENVLALTFTDKAAAEMKRRVSEVLPDLTTTPHISTFHAFCYAVLRKRHFERRLLDKVDVWIFLRRRMAHLGLEFYQKLAEPGAFLHDLNDFFSRCQDELIEPDDFDQYVQKVEKDFEVNSRARDPADQGLRVQEIEKLKELSRVFRNSRKFLEEAGCSSLGSLIPETVHLFDREPEFLAHYRARFRYVLVDEFQDTNYAQVELLRRLVAPPFNMTGVGDDDQAIYRFRGASHGAFEMFRQAFGADKSVYLNRNYRSTKKILRVADVVIEKNDDRYREKPKLKSEEDEGARVFLVESPDYRGEAVWVADEVGRLVKRGASFGEIAILYRAHAYRDLVVEKFRRRGIPFAIRGVSILSTVILRDLLAYLSLIESPHENISLTRVLLMPRWKFPEEVALEARRQAAKNRSSLFGALNGMEKSLFRAEVEATGWPELKQLLGELRAAANRLPMTSLLDRLVERLEISFLPGQPDAEYLEAFRKFLEDWEEKSERRKLREFMEYFQYFQEAGGKIEAPEPADSANAVQMMTVHTAKGREFPVVFVLSVAPRRFPHSEQKPVIEFPDEMRRSPLPPGDIHLEEERRLFYVAMTRAKGRLYISSVTKPGRKPSKFVDDLLSDGVVRARDIETIQVPETSPEEVAPVAAHRSQPPAERGTQAALFGAGTSLGAVYPPVAEWASRPPSVAPEEKLQLSASSIETYLDCPLKFKFIHYQKIPTGPQPALTFGNIMHQCVRRYFDLRKKSLPRFEEIEESYLGLWKAAGFEDAYQEQVYKQAGLEQLRQFVETQNAQTLAAERVRMEEHFEVNLGEVVLEGRIDQVNPLEERGPRKRPAVELIDYKTGRPRSQKDADQSLQLSVYALAARDGLRSDAARLTFYNLTNNQPVSTVRTPQDLEKAAEEIRDVAERIRKRLFDPTPGYVCKWCDFVRICPAHEEKS